MGRATLFSSLALVLLASSCIHEKGCTDELAINYEYKATIDDGSCIYPAPPPPPPPPKAVPASYDFKNVDYQKATDLQHHLEVIKEGLLSAEANSATYDASLFTTLLNNTNNDGNGNYGFSSEYSLSEIMDPADIAIAQAAADAHSAVPLAPAMAGIAAGLLQTKDGRFSFYTDIRGICNAYMLDKFIMGAAFMNQVSTVHFSEENIGAFENARLPNGERASKEEQRTNLDLAFGYLGVPTTFPNNTVGVRFWGEDCNELNDVLNTNQIGLAFREARTAISNGEYDTRENALNKIVLNWEKTILGEIGHWLNIAIDHASDGTKDDARRHHALSSALGYIYALQKNELSEIEDIAIQDAIAAIIAGPNGIYDLDTEVEIITVRDNLLNGTVVSNFKDQL